MLTLVLFLVALILAAIEQVRAKGQSLTLWAILCLAFGLCLAHGLLR